MAAAAAISRFPRLGLFQYFFPVHSAALPSPGDLKEFYQIIDQKRKADDCCDPIGLVPAL